MTNSTQDRQEILQESPSEKITFHNRSISQGKERLPIKKKYQTSKIQNNQGAKNDKDLTVEANVFSPVLTFTETPMIDHWQIVSEIIPYKQQYRFTNPIPIIESQSFMNTPELTSIQKNYNPEANLHGRTTHPNSEYSDSDSSYSNDRYPESKNPPSPGHAVHTETIHDFGRFLPEDYKSKIEKEAELLIKEKKTESTTTAAATTNTPQSYDRDTPSHNRENQQKARGYPPRYQKPVNTAFFHKGNFESAYPFPNSDDNQNDERHIATFEGNPSKPRVLPLKEHVKIGEPYKPSIGDKPTIMYHRDYSYPPEQDSTPGNYYNADSYQKNPYHDQPPVDGMHLGNVHQKDQKQYNRGVYVKNQQYENPNYRDRNPTEVHHKNPHKHVIKENNRYHENAPLTTSHDQTNHQNYRGPHSSTFRQQNENRGYIPHNDPYPRDPHHTGPPNSPQEYGSSAKAYAPTYPDTYQKPILSYSSSTPYSSQEYSQPEQQNLPKEYLNSKNPSPPNTEFYRPVTDLPQKDTYSSHPSKPYAPTTDSLKFTKNSELHSTIPFRPLAKNPLQPDAEKPYYNSFKSLADLYKSFDFQPFHFGEMPTLRPRFPYDSSFYGKIEVSGPTSGYGPTNDFIPLPPTYPENTNSPRDQNFNGNHDQYSNVNCDGKENVPSNVNHAEPYSNMKYNSREKYPDTSYFKHTSSEGSINPQYPQHIPYDTNPPPAVSVEHYGPPETSQPHHALNTQIEAPKEAFVEDGYNLKPHSYSTPIAYPPLEGEKVEGIRIKDYDAETFFGGSPQPNLNSLPESEFNPGAFSTNTSLYPHSVVRQNPYNIRSTYSGEVDETYRPRQYRQKLKIEIDASVEDSNERSNNFHSTEKALQYSSPSHNSGNSNLDYSTDIQPYDPYNAYNDNQENESGFKRPKEPSTSINKNQQRRPNSKRISKNKNSNNNSEYRHGKKRKNSSKLSDEDKFTYKQPESRVKSRHVDHSDYSLPRHRKRSSHRSSRKNRSSNKPQPDHMRAEGSTYHWGMEKHKGTDGFFQYANVPGAKAFEFGYRMGGPEHTRERHHRTIGAQSKIKVNWEDGNGDTGDHYWEYNHNAKENNHDDADDKENKPKSKSKAEPESEPEKSSEESAE